MEREGGAGRGVGGSGGSGVVVTVKQRPAVSDAVLTLSDHMMTSFCYL